MSFDLIVSVYDGTDQPVAIPADAFERVFGGNVALRDGDFRRLAYPDGSEADIYGGADSFMINHAGGDLFYEALVRFLRDIGGVICWPGPGCAIAVEATRQKVPPALVEALGPPTCVSTGRELLACILAP